jgi:ABC-type Fe3+/spermidine/putrescine transport system ATPase subunit
MTESTSGMQIENTTLILPNGVVMDIPDILFISGSLTILVGPNAGGKSTFATFVSGLYRDKPRGLTDFPVLVWQSPELFPGTVRRNVDVSTWGKKGNWAGANEVDSALRLFDIFSVSERKIEGLNGGHQQRVSLARGFLAATNGIVLDEPTLSLDSEGIETLVEVIGVYLMRGSIDADSGIWLRQMPAKRRFVLVISHDRGFIERLECYEPRFMGLDRSLNNPFSRIDHVVFDAGGGQGYSKATLRQTPPTHFWADFLGLPNIFFVEHERSSIQSPREFKTKGDPRGLIVMKPEDFEICEPTTNELKQVLATVSHVDSKKCLWSVHFKNQYGEKVVAVVEVTEPCAFRPKIGEAAVLRLRKGVISERFAPVASTVKLESSNAKSC